jgi:isocitrate dehydrogenase
MTQQNVPITVAMGDGIGPEIMDATLRILQAAGARIAIEEVEIGEKVYQRGYSAGIDDATWASLERTRVFLKAPITTPQGGGFKSLNVTTRKALGLFANIRPCRTYYPFVDTKHPNMDVVIVRENEEDLYAGIEHRQTDEVYQCLKLITRPGSEKIIRYAFEYAVANGRKKVTCFSKDNIMKMTDGLFHKVFDEIGAEYPQIEKEHWIIDIGAAKLADSPDAFDVVVMANLYGDILSDVAAQIAGSVGLAGSANIGVNYAMFEAIHGSAPRRAGQNMANPTGLINGAILMLIHIGQPDVATRVHNALLKTIEDGIHTYDIFREGRSRQKVGTREFADAVIARMGEKPATLAPVDYGEPRPMNRELYISKRRPPQNKTLVGVDIFVHRDEQSPDRLADAFNGFLHNAGLEVTMISNRGTKVWPKGHPETFLTDHWRIRTMARDRGNDVVPVKHTQIVEALSLAHQNGFDFIKTENLYYFDGEPGFVKSAGE